MGILYTKMKIFNFKDKLNSLSRTVNEIMPPIHIRIKPTNICCHNCKYCAYGKNNLTIFGKDKIKKTFISKEKIVEILSDIAEMGVKAVTFSGGGEPLVYPHILDSIKELFKAGIKFSSLTNGALLQGELAKYFALHGTWVRVSMDGWDDKSYSYYRGVPHGEFTRIMTNMKNFRKYSGKCHLGVSLIIDKINAPHIYKIASNLKDIGVDSVKMSPCLVNDNAVDNNRYHRLFFKDVKLQIKKVTKNLADDSFEVFDSYAELDEKFKKDYNWCPYLQILPIIGADLNVYSCPDKAYNLKNGCIGSIKNQRFKDFWFSDKNKYFKINPSVHCNHHCETNQKNKLILEYLNIDKEHLNFV